VIVVIDTYVVVMRSALVIYCCYLTFVAVTAFIYNLLIDCVVVVVYLYLLFGVVPCCDSTARLDGPLRCARCYYPVGLLRLFVDFVGCYHPSVIYLVGGTFCLAVRAPRRLRRAARQNAAQKTGVPAPTPALPVDYRSVTRVVPTRNSPLRWLPLFVVDLFMDY